MVRIAGWRLAFSAFTESGDAAELFQGCACLRSPSMFALRNFSLGLSSRPTGLAELLLKSTIISIVSADLLYVCRLLTVTEPYHCCHLQTWWCSLSCVALWQYSHVSAEWAGVAWPHSLVEHHAGHCYRRRCPLLVCSASQSVDDWFAEVCEQQSDVPALYLYLKGLIIPEGRTSCASGPAFIVLDDTCCRLIMAVVRHSWLLGHRDDSFAFKAGMNHCCAQGCLAEHLPVG